MVRAKTHFLAGNDKRWRFLSAVSSLSLSLRFLSPLMFGVLIRRVYGVYCEGEERVSSKKRERESEERENLSVHVIHTQRHTHTHTHSLFSPPFFLAHTVGMRTPHCCVRPTLQCSLCRSAVAELRRSRERDCRFLLRRQSSSPSLSFLLRFQRRCDYCGCSEAKRSGLLSPLSLSLSLSVCVCLTVLSADLFFFSLFLSLCVSLFSLPTSSSLFSLSHCSLCDLFFPPLFFLFFAVLSADLCFSLSLSLIVPLFLSVLSAELLFQSLLFLAVRSADLSFPPSRRFPVSLCLCLNLCRRPCLAAFLSHPLNPLLYALLTVYLTHIAQRH